MVSFLQYLKQSISIVLVSAVFCVGAALAQQSTGTLRGRVADESGAVIVGANVTATDAAAVERATTTNDEGVFVLSGLAPGAYIVRASSEGFALYENTTVSVAPGRTAPLDITLGITITSEEVTVASEPPVSTDPANNAGAIVLRETDIDALPDNPEDLAAALEALAGPGAT
jgi:hypothetical protein